MKKQTIYLMRVKKTHMTRIGCSSYGFTKSEINKNKKWFDEQPNNPLYDSLSHIFRTKEAAEKALKEANKKLSIKKWVVKNKEGYILESHVELKRFYLQPWDLTD